VVINRAGANGKVFSIVGFDDDSVALVSSSWLTENSMCYWPPEYNRRLAAAHSPVEEDWVPYHCRVLGTAGKLFTILNNSGGQLSSGFAITLTSIQVEDWRDGLQIVGGSCDISAYYTVE